MIILVTGASRGLGYELVKKGLCLGHTLIATCQSEIQTAIGLCNLKQQYPDTLTIIQMDVTSESMVLRAANQVKQKYDRVDCVINNAGVLYESKYNTDDPIVTMDIEMMKKTLLVNTVGPAIVLKYFMPLIYNSDDACVINVTSEAGSLKPKGHIYMAYGISKYATNMYTQKIRNYLTTIPTGEKIRMFMLHPGRMNTVMGVENALMEAEESARGIYDIIEKKIDPKLEIPFINWMGEELPH